MITIENLVKVYGKQKVVDNLNLEVKKGEIFGFLGPNGAGKTTTIRMLTTLTKQTSGTIKINGFDIKKEPQKTKEQFGIVQQHMSLDKDLSVKENLQLHARLRHYKEADIKEFTKSALEYVGGAEKANVIVDKLSGGMRRRIMIARALMHKPKIIFLDEPTAGLDAQTRRSLWQTIRNLNLKGTTIFLTTHYIEEAEALCDRVAIINKGKIIALDTPAKLKEKIGKYAVETLNGNGEQEYNYFPSEVEAREYVKKLPEHVKTIVIRQSNLEDVFVELTGKQMSAWE